MMRFMGAMRVRSALYFWVNAFLVSFVVFFRLSHTFFAAQPEPPPLRSFAGKMKRKQQREKKKKKREANRTTSVDKHVLL